MTHQIRTPLFLICLTALTCTYTQVHAADARIGFLSPATAESSAIVLDGLRQGLRENGYLEGRNLIIEVRFANGKFEQLPDLARNLINLPVNVLVTFVTQATIAARDNTKTVPIVMIGVSDPVLSGVVSSLSRPGGNVTGTSGMSSDIAGKQLQLLSEVIPGAKRIAVLWNPVNSVFQRQLLREAELAARPLGLELQMFEGSDAESIEKAFVAMSNGRISGLFVLLDPTLSANSARIAALAVRARLPSISGSSVYAEANGLMAYGPSFPELARSAGAYVAKILNGAKPDDLPVERPTNFEFVINLKAAKNIEQHIPQTLRLRADRLIE